MWAVVVIALCCQAPKASELGRAKPWWEALKPGDEVRLSPAPGTRIPLVRLERYSDVEQRYVPTDIYATMFAESVAGRRWDEVHRMIDRDQIVPDGPGQRVRIRAIRRDPTLRMDVAEIGSVGGYWVPVAYLGAPGQPRHPDMARLPVLERRSMDRSSLRCDERACGRMEAIPFVEFERGRKERERRSEEIRRRTAAARGR